MRYFSTKPPANRVAQIKQGRASARLAGAAILAALVIGCLMVGTVLLLAYVPAL